MKKRLSILLILTAVLALGAFLLWYGRSQSFADVVPTTLGPLTRWDVQLYHEKTGQSSTFPLDLQQAEQVANAFSGQTLRRRYGDLDGAAHSYQSSMDPWARIFLIEEARPEGRCELMLVGDCLVVNQIGADKVGTYTLSGGQEFQEELVRLLLDFSA